MLLRILIIVFAFNVVISSAFAAGDIAECDMMPDSMSMSLSTSDATCSMPDMDKSCESSLCLSSCFVNIIPFQEKIIHAVASLRSFEQPHFKMAHFYKIIHPVQTPPPLV